MILRRLTSLDAVRVSRVLALVDAAEAADGVRPLSEHVELHLRHGGDIGVVHVLAEVSGEIAGYAHLDVTDLVQGPSAELVVHPGHRRHGVAGMVIGDLLRRANGRLRLWAHASLPGAAELAARNGFQQSRKLWQLGVGLDEDFPAPRWPADVLVRTFVPGQDDEAWVGLNRIAFKDLPDQGGWTLADLRMRMAEPWFDPAGFFMVEREGRLVGFHWTKVHGGEAPHAHPHPPEAIGHSHPESEHHHPPLGEVYVVGVDPGEQGRGLGAALTLAGLHHLQHRGLGAAMLYVDDDNASARHLYGRLGFQEWSHDVLYRIG